MHAPVHHNPSIIKISNLGFKGYQEVGGWCWIRLFVASFLWSWWRNSHHQQQHQHLFLQTTISSWPRFVSTSAVTTLPALSCNLASDSNAFNQLWSSSHKLLHIIILHEKYFLQIVGWNHVIIKWKFVDSVTFVWVLQMDSQKLFAVNDPEIRIKIFCVKHSGNKAGVLSVMRIIFATHTCWTLVLSPR